MTIRLLLHTFIIGIFVCLGAPIFGAAEMPAHARITTLLKSHFDEDIIEGARLDSKAKQELTKIIQAAATLLSQIKPTIARTNGFKKNTTAILNTLNRIHASAIAYVDTRALEREREGHVQQLQTIENTLRTQSTIADLNITTITMAEAVAVLKKHKLNTSINNVKKIKDTIAQIDTAIKENDPKRTISIDNDLQAISSKLYEIKEMHEASIQFPDAYIDAGLTLSITLDPENDATLCAYAAAYGLSNGNDGKSKKGKTDIVYSQEFDVVIINDAPQIRECKDTSHVGEYIPCSIQQTTILEIIRQLKDKYPERYLEKIACDRDKSVVDALMSAKVSLHYSQKPHISAESIALLASAANTDIHTTNEVFIGHNRSKPTGVDSTPKKIRRALDVAKTAPRANFKGKRPRGSDSDDDNNNDSQQQAQEPDAKRRKHLNYAIELGPHDGLPYIQTFAANLESDGISVDCLHIEAGADDAEVTDIAQLFGRKTPGPASRPTTRIDNLYIRATPVPGRRTATPFTRIPLLDRELLFDPIAPLIGRISRLSTDDIPASTPRSALEEDPADENGAALMDM